MSDPSRRTYVKKIIDCYRATPGTRGRVRTADRRLAEDLFRRGVTVQQIRMAFFLAAARRSFRDPGLGPLQTIASLHYFLPVIEEVRRQPLDPDYLDYIKARLDAADLDHRSA